MDGQADDSEIEFHEAHDLTPDRVAHVESVVQQRVLRGIGIQTPSRSESQGGTGAPGQTRRESGSTSGDRSRRKSPCGGPRAGATGDPSQELGVGGENSAQVPNIFSAVGIRLPLTLAGGTLRRPRARSGTFSRETGGSEGPTRRREGYAQLGTGLAQFPELSVATGCWDPSRTDFGWAPWSAYRRDE